MGGIGDLIEKVVQPVARAVGVDENEAGEAIGAMIPGLGDYMGAKETNAANAAQSATQMAFQERMSNTAHQREVADLKAAGLNPILSVNAGSSSPVGSQATMQNPNAGVSEKIQASLMNMLAAKQVAASTELTEAQKDKTKTETRAIQPGAIKGDVISDIYHSLKKGWEDAKKANAGMTDKEYQQYRKKKGFKLK